MDAQLAESLQTLNLGACAQERHEDQLVYTDQPPSYEDIATELWDPSDNAHEAAQTLYPLGNLRRISNDGLLPYTPTPIKTSETEQRSEHISYIKDIITILVDCPDFKTFLNLLQSRMEPCIEFENSILPIIDANSHIFLTIQSPINEPIIELCPFFEFCEAYISATGCYGKCASIHICRDFIKGQCYRTSDCFYGHSFKNTYNASILSRFCLEDIEEITLVSLARKVLRRSSVPRLCQNYNENKCLYDNCFDLHICFHCVSTNGRCLSDNCPLNHSIFDSQCTGILQSAGVLVDRASEEDLLKMIATKELKERGAETMEGAASSSFFEYGKPQLPDGFLDLPPKYDTLIETGSGNELDNVDGAAAVTSGATGRRRGNRKSTVHIKVVRNSHRSKRHNSHSNTLPHDHKEIDPKSVRQVKKEVRIQRKIEKQERKLERMQDKLEDVRRRAGY